MKWYVMALRRFADFKGRSQRMEYWMFWFYSLVLAVVLGLVIGNAGSEVFLLAYQLVILVVGTSVGVRRLHDIGKSGWWLLLSLVPLVGSLVLLYFAIKDSQPGSNQYGPNPKEALWE